MLAACGCLMRSSDCFRCSILDFPRIECYFCQFECSMPIAFLRLCCCSSLLVCACPFMFTSRCAASQYWFGAFDACVCKCWFMSATFRSRTIIIFFVVVRIDLPKTCLIFVLAVFRRLDQLVLKTCQSVDNR